MTNDQLVRFVRQTRNVMWAWRLPVLSQTARVGLARNPVLRELDDTRAQVIRRALLEDASSRVRTAARRAGLAMNVGAFLAALDAEEGRPIEAPGETRHVGEPGPKTRNLLPDA